MDVKEIRKRLIAAYKLLSEETTSRRKFESVRSLIKGINPQIDTALESCSKALKELGKVRKRKVIDLTVKRLPENTEKQKKRKKTFLLFLKRWKKLKRTVKRVSGEYQKGQEGEAKAPAEQAKGLGKSLAFTKGLLGVLTAIAVAAVGGFMYLKSNKAQDVQKTATEKEMIKVEPPKLVVGDGVSEDTDDSAPSYWIQEGSYDVMGDQAVWGIHVHIESDETRAWDEHLPAAGAVVTVELRGSSGAVTPLTGTVDPGQGWMRWTQPLPTEEIELYIVDLQGELPWARTNQLAWKDRPLASSRPDP